MVDDAKTESGVMMECEPRILTGNRAKKFRYHMRKVKDGRMIRQPSSSFSHQRERQAGSSKNKEICQKETQYVH